MLGKIVWLFLLSNLLQAEVDIRDCGKSRGCLFFPSECSSTSTCDSIVSYQYNKTADVFLFELSTKHKWVGFGQKLPKDGGSDMEKIRGVYCARTEPASIGNFHGNMLTRPTRPAFLDNVNGVTKQSIKIENGLIICRVEHVVVPPSEGNYSVWQSTCYPTNFLDGVRPGYHSGYGKSVEPIDFFRTTIVGSTQGRKARQVEVAHGICMVIAWVFFATIGIFMSRYMKPATKERMILGKQAWFPVHVFSMAMCVTFLVIGLILILTKHRHIDTGNKHHMIGLFTVIFGLIQPVIAFFRPAPDHEKRFLFNWIHRIVGMGAWFLGACAIIYGLNLFSKNAIPMVVFIALVVVLFVILDVVFCFTSNNTESVVSYNDDSNAKMGLESFDKMLAQENDRKHSISWVMLIVVFGLALCFTLYHLVIIAQLD